MNRFLRTAFWAAVLVGLMGALRAQAPVKEQKIDPLQLVAAARAQVGVTKTYDPEYRVLDYPGGDVPLEVGVCTDVVVRALRRQGVDLQVLLHEDMTRDFRAYPQSWGLRTTDKNIDHRRVP